MRKTAGALALIILSLIPIKAWATPEWLEYYLSCVSLSANEEACYRDISDYLATDAGRQEALAVQFQRQTQTHREEEVAQSVVLVQRMEQMQSNLSKAVEKNSAQPSLALCFGERLTQMETLVQGGIQIRDSYLSRQEFILPGAIEKLKDLSRQADVLYRQAQGCVN